MSEQATHATPLVITIEDSQIFSFLDTTVGTLDTASYTNLVKRLLAIPTVTQRQKSELMTNAIHQNRAEHVTALLSFGIGLITENSVINNGRVYALKKVFTEDVAKILLANILDMDDKMFKVVRQYYQGGRRNEVEYFTSLYENTENHTALAQFFTRVGIVPATAVPLAVAMTCGRADVFNDSTKNLILAAIAMQDRHEKELAETKKELADKEAVLSMAQHNLKLALAGPCKDTLQQDLDTANRTLAELRAIVIPQ